VLLALSICVAASLDAQRVVSVRSAVIIESYSFDEGLPFDRVTELSVPLGINVQLGRAGTLALSTGWANVALTSSNAAVLEDQSRFGFLDTEARLSLNVVPGRLMVLANGAIPTGIETVEEQEVTLLGAIASDIIGFSTSDLGGGGNVGGGFVGAFPMGQFALGVAATYRQPLAYLPVLGETEKLRPGGELRVRSGVEGPLGRRTYLRIAGIYAARAKPDVGGQPDNGVGNRIVGYVSLNQGIGQSTLILYGFDVYRADPRIESTGAGAAILPRGNLVAAGMRWGFRLGTGTSVTPRFELRSSSAAPDETDTTLRLAGRSFRGGTDLRQQVNRHLAVVLQADGVFGFVRQEGANINLNGFRFGLHGEVTP
jgi:hypothetical protein